MNHHELGMSRWSTLVTCPHFSPKEGEKNELSSEGTNAHKDLELILKGEKHIGDEGNNESAEWCANYLWNGYVKNNPLYETVWWSSEQRVEIQGIDPLLNGIFGTADFIAYMKPLQNNEDKRNCLVIADFKTFGNGKECFDEQLAGYAVGVLGFVHGVKKPDGFKFLQKDFKNLKVELVTCHGAIHFAKRLETTIDECVQTSKDVIGKYYHRVEIEPAVNTKCKYCCHYPCQAHQKIARIEEQKKTDERYKNILTSSVEDLEQDNTKIPVLLAYIEELEKMCKNAKANCVQAVKEIGEETEKDGLKNWKVSFSDSSVEVMQKNGNRKISDILSAWDSVKSSVDQMQFLGICTCKVTDLISLFAKSANIKKAEAEQKLNDCGIFERGKPKEEISRK